MAYIKLEPFEATRAKRVLNEDQRFYKRYKPHVEQSVGSVVKSIEFNPVKPWEVALTHGTQMHVYSLKSGQATMRISSFKEYANSASYRKDGKLMVCTDASGLVQIADMTNKKILRKLRGHEESVSVARFGSTSQVLSGGHDKLLKLWDISEAKAISTVEGHSDYIQAMQVSPLSEHTWITGGYDKLVKVWDSRIGDDTGFKSVMQFEHGAGVEDLVIMPSGLMCMSAGGTTVRTWDLATGKSLSSFSHHTKAVTSLALNQAATAVLSASLDGTMKVTDLTEYQVVGSFKTNKSSPAMCVSWAPDNIMFCAGTQDGTWIARKNKVLANQKNPRTAAKPKVLRGGTTAFFKRGPRTQPSQGDEMVKSEKMKITSQDYLFRRFEYKKLIDDVATFRVDMAMGLSIVDRLSQQGGLEYALSERSDEDCQRVLHWSTNALKQNVAYHPLVREVIYCVLENQCFVEPSPALVAQLKRINLVITTELINQTNLTPVQGLLDLIMQ